MIRSTDKCLTCAQIAWLVLLSWASDCALAAAALPVVSELEPNDEPHQGQVFSAPVLLSGAMPKVGDQDAFRWQISDADAQRLWTLTLTGMPEALTGVSLNRVTFDESGKSVTERETLLSFGIRDGSRPVRHADLLLPPGELVVGVFGAGQSRGGFQPPNVELAPLQQAASAPPEDAQPPLTTAYRVAIDAGTAITVRTGKARDTMEQAGALRPGAVVAEIQRGKAWYRFEVPASDEPQRITVNAAIDLSRQLQLALVDSAGSTVSEGRSDRFGKISLPNLVLEPGAYFLKTADVAKGEVAAVRRVQWRQVGAVADGEEQEPNATWAKANQIAAGSALSGRMDQKGEADYFRFELSDALAAKPWNMALQSEDLKRVQLCLLDENGKSRQCRSGAPPVTLRRLVLNAGVHGLSVARSTEAGSYAVEFTEQSPLPPRSEQEPNDNAADASLFGKGRILKGTLSRQDADHVLLLTTEEPQLWRVQAIGQNLQDLGYRPQHGSGVQSVRAGADSRRLRLDNLFLLPGQHHFSLTARQDTSYVLRALPLGPPSPHVEREPNDGRSKAHSLRLNHKTVALLTEKSDVDWYRFYLAAAQTLSLALRPAADAGYRVTLYQDGGQLKQFALAQGAALKESLWLDPGDYYLSVSSSPTSEAEYELQLDQVAAPARVSDREPNDRVNLAAPWPVDGAFKGTLGVSRAGADWYRLLPREQPQTFVLPKLSGQRLAFVDANRRSIAKATTDPEGVTRITLPAATESYLYLSGKGGYAFRITGPDADAASSAEPGALPLEMQFAPDFAPVAAYSDWQQNLTAQLKLHNTGPEALTMSLQATTTDDRWQLQVPSTSITLDAGQQRTLALPLTVAPDAWPDTAVSLRVTAADRRNRQARADHALVAERQAQPANPALHQPVPQALQGHINVGLAARGARWRADPKKFSALNDGLLALGWYFQSKRDGRTGPAVEVPVLELAGANLVPVTGFSLHPFGLQDGQPAQRNAQEFAIALSSDGQSFETVLTGTLSRHQREQFFVLDEPRPARFARLHLLSSTDAQGIALGEWKVLAAPASVPEAQSANLADPDFGGHVVSMSPPQPNYGYLKPLLKAADSRVNNRQQAGFDAGWVIGFHHNRAARIDRLSWRNEDQGQPFAAAEVLVSRDSPLGPWTSVGDWALDGDGEQQFVLPAPVWARFVKFDVADTPVRTTMTLPAQIKIFEAADEYGTILGEWGYDSFRGPYELAHPADPEQVPDALPAHTVRERAQRLSPDEPLAGVVRLGHYDNWYAVQVPEGHNQLTLTLSGTPLLRAEATLRRDEEPLVLETLEALPGRQVLGARVTPGTYLVRVSEPPRSVVFTWDTSGSTAAVRPIIRQAVMSYIQDVKPGLDEARMLPFGGSFLSSQWLDQPYMLQSVLNDYNGAGNSSEAETAIVKASRALQKRRGQRVIVLITDAATGSDRQLWTTLEQTRPRIIALGVSSRGAFGSNPPRERDLMQDWAMVGEGYYEYIENAGAMERAFDRASSKIRQPANYSIGVQTRFEPDPEPGFLQVLYAEPGQEPDVQLPQRTIEVVLDASGSMLQRMEGKRRYQIARETLEDLLAEQLPDSVHFGLRVFGHEEPGACRTDLVMPPAKLDREAATRILERIVPKNLAKTPIADSLKATARDLSGVPGEKVVLLITDGEETCGGDVEAAIEALSGTGVAAVLNVIGFGVDDPELTATFARWAQAGGGSYRSAGSAQSLGVSTAALAAAGFSVLSDGEEITQGFSGGPPIPLPAGRYQLRIDQGQSIDVDIPAGGTRTVTLSQ